MAKVVKKNKITSMTDNEVINEIKGGSNEAFEELVQRYESKVYNLAIRFTRNHEDAEEVLQDVFTSVYRKIEGFEGKSAFSSWIYRVVVNAAFMKLRKRKQSPTVSMEDLSPSARQEFVEQHPTHIVQSDISSMNRELREVLEQSITRLPDEYRAVYVLRDIDGLSNQEVGEILDLSIPAVKSRLHRSRLMLRKKLQAYWDEYTGRKFRRSAHFSAEAAEAVGC